MPVCDMSGQTVANFELDGSSVSLYLGKGAHVAIAQFEDGTTRTVKFVN